MKIAKLLKTVNRKLKIKKRLGILSLAFVVVGGGILIIWSNLVARPIAAWFDDRWSYRQTVPISNSGSNLTDYQVSFTLNTSSTDANGLIKNKKMKADCSDLRVTDINGKAIPFWVEENNPGCDNTATKIWARVPSIPAGTNSTNLFVYYGNSNATALSNGDTTFLFFDDFDKNMLDPAKWTDVNSSGATFNSGVMTISLTGDGNMHYIQSLFTTTPGVAIRTREKDNVTTTYYTGEFGFGARTGPNQNFVQKSVYSTYTYTLNINNGGAENYNSATSGDSSWHVWDLVWQSSATKLFNDGSQIGSTLTSLIPTVALPVTVGCPDYTPVYHTHRTDMDWIVVRNLAATEPTTSAPANEEVNPSPVAYWRFDEGYGTQAVDSTQNNNVGAIANATWQTEDQCISGKCLYFNGTNAAVSVASTVANVQTVAFWVKPITATNSLIDLNDANSITATNSAVTANGFGSPTYYINGVARASPTLTTNQWNYVEITTATPVNASVIKIGQVGAGYTNGFLDEVKLYDYARSSSQVKLDYAAGLNRQGLPRGTGAALGGANPDIIGPVSSGLVGYWKMDEASGNAADSSGNGITLTNNGTTTFTTGKFGNSAYFDVGTKYLSTTTAIIGVETISFWINPNATTSNIVDFNGVQAILAVSGTIYTNNFSTSTVVYVNGVQSSTLKAGVWQHVVVVTNSAFNTGTMTIGKIAPSSSLNGYLDEVRFYNRVLSPLEIVQLYNWAPGPAAYWNFEEGQGTAVNDTSGNGNLGTWGGTAPYWTTGKYGRAGNFNGSNSYVSVPSSSSISYERTQPFSVELWANPSNTTNSFLISKYDSSAYGWALDDFDTGQDFAVILRGGSTQNNIYVNSSGVSTFNVGTWHHVAFTYDGSSKAAGVKIYLDGVATGLSIVKDNLTATVITTHVLELGARTVDPRYFAGKIDEIRIYNYVRTPGQIVQDMNGGHPQGGSPVGSAADWWKFDDGYGTGASSSGYVATQGTLVGMASPPSVGTNGWQTAGKYGKAVAFPGVSGASAAYVNFGRVSYTEGIGTMSASLWVLPNALSTSTCLLCKWSDTAAAGSRSWAIETGSSNASAVKVEISTDGNTGIASGETAAGKLAVGTWTHVEVVYDGSQYLLGNTSVLKIYVNGVLQTLTFSGTVPTNAFAGTVNLRAGVSSDATAANIARAFSGMIDEVKIYTAALSSTGVLVDYNHGSGIVMGSLSDTSGLSGGSVASNSASAEYCVPGDTTPCAAPLARWDLDEAVLGTVNDLSGNGYAGTDTGGTQVVQGKIGRGRSMNATGDYVSVPHNAALNLAAGSAYTWSAWVNFKTPDTSGQYGIVAKGDCSASGVNCWDFDFRGNTTGLEFIMKRTSGQIEQMFSQSTAFVAGRWYYVALTTTNMGGPSSGYTFYVNGVNAGLVVGSDQSPASITSTVVLSIGNVYQGAFDSPIKGSIDNVRIYSYARTPAQISWEYNQGKAASYFDFDECQGTVVHDFMSATNSGTLTGGTPGTCNDGTGTTEWSAGRIGKFNYSLNFDGTDYVNVSTPMNYVEAVSFWAKPTSTSQSFLQLSSAVNAVAASGVVSGWSGASVYVNGKLNGTVTANNWNHIVLTNTTSTSASAIKFGLVGSTYYSGQLDDIRIFTYPLTATQIRLLYNQASGIRFGPIQGSP